MTHSQLPNLLIVDDSEMNLLYLKMILKNNPVKIISANSGPEALEKIRNLELALAIIDVYMPEMDGFELAVKINEERPDAKVPVIFLTAQNFNTENQIKGYGSGAVDFIFQPVDRLILNSKVNVFLDLFLQKQAVIQNVNERIKAEEDLKQLTSELEQRIINRTTELIESNIENQKIRHNYESFFNTIDDFIFVVDTEGKIIHTNSTVNNRLGYAGEQLSGKPCTVVFPLENPDEVKKTVTKVLSGNMDSCAIPLVAKSGNHIPVETKASQGIWGDKPALFLVSKDVSKIQMSETKFSKVFHINPSACGLSDRNDGRYLEVNDAFLSLFGFEKHEVIGRTAMELGIMTSETRSKILEQVDSKGRIHNIETDLKAKSGEIKHVILSSDNIVINDEDIRFTVVNDITKRRIAENALIKSEAMLKKAQQIAKIGSWELDEVAQILTWSDETFRMFGYEPDEVEASMELFLQHVHKESLPSLLEIIEAAKNALIPYVADHRIVLPDGSERFVHEQAEIIYDENGKAKKWIGTVQDITDQKLFEDELKSTIEKLHNLTQYVEKVREEERVAISRELHDELGQALTAVKIDLSLISQKVKDPETVSKIEKVSSLINETIRAVQRITSELRPPVLDDLGLEAAIQWYTGEFAQRNNIEVILRLDDLTSVSSEVSLHIFRIMQESLTNIARHAKADKIEIELTQSTWSLFLSIRDNGLGITHDQLNSKTAFGINSMKERAAALGGNLDIQRNGDHGTTVTLTMPSKSE